MRPPGFQRWPRMQKATLRFEFAGQSPGFHRALDGAIGLTLPVARKAESSQVVAEKGFEVVKPRVYEAHVSRPPPFWTMLVCAEWMRVCVGSIAARAAPDDCP